MSVREKRKSVKRMSLKQDLICSNCSKILDKPIILPCSDTICMHHLNEANVIKENKIKCLTCKEEFNLSDNASLIRPNKGLQKLIDNERYLSDEEKNLKLSIENDLDILSKLFDEFRQIKVKLDLACHEHLAEVRRKIDLHREELKARIDDIAIEMIEQTKRFEATQAASLNKKFEQTLADAESSDTQLNDVRHVLKEKFRNPDLSLDSIKEVKIKYDEEIADLKVNI